jgi:hypothetical protein
VASSEETPPRVSRQVTAVLSVVSFLKASPRSCGAVNVGPHGTFTVEAPGFDKAGLFRVYYLLAACLLLS